MPELPHASTRFPSWARAWSDSGRLVLLLDFDGTLAPIVDRPVSASMLPASRSALERLAGRNDVNLAIVSGRGLDDARSLARIANIAYAGNHGMEIEIAGIREVHGEAASARPDLDIVADELRGRLTAVEGALVEDKGLTLSIHFRLVAPTAVADVRDAVAAAVERFERLRVTEGKRVLEIRPRVDWHKGRAVAFLLDHLRPPSSAPILYVGDDRTDEDAFRALRDGAFPGDGVVVAEHPPSSTSAIAWLASPEEVADLLEAFASAAP
jgi:trehalose 6-phosphate phosphatase